MVSGNKNTTRKRAVEPGRYVSEYHLSMPHHWEGVSNLSVKESILRTGFAGYMANPKMDVIGTESSSLEDYRRDMAKVKPDASNYMLDLMVYAKDQELQNEKRAENARMRREVRHRRKQELDKKIEAIETRQFVDASTGKPVSMASKQMRSWMKEAYPSDYRKYAAVTKMAEEFDHATRKEVCKEHMAERQKKVEATHEERQKKADAYQAEMRAAMAKERALERKANNKKREAFLDNAQQKFKSRIDTVTSKMESKIMKADQTIQLQKELRENTLREQTQRKEDDIKRVRANKEGAFEASQAKKEGSMNNALETATIRHASRKAMEARLATEKKKKKEQQIQRHVVAKQSREEEEANRLATVTQKETEKHNKSVDVLDKRADDHSQLVKQHKAVEAKHTVRNAEREIENDRKGREKMKKVREKEAVANYNYQTALAERSERVREQEAFRAERVQLNRELLQEEQHREALDEPAVTDLEDNDATPRNEVEPGRASMRSVRFAVSLGKQPKSTSSFRFVNNSSLPSVGNDQDAATTTPSSLKRHHSFNVDTDDEDSSLSPSHYGGRTPTKPSTMSPNKTSTKSQKFKNDVAQRWAQMDEAHETRRQKLLDQHDRRQATADAGREQLIKEIQKQAASSTKAVETHQQQAAERQAQREERHREKLEAKMEKIAAVPGKREEERKEAWANFHSKREGYWKGWDEVERLGEHHCTAYHRIHVVAPPREFSEKSKFPNPVRQAIADRNARDVRSELREEHAEARDALIETLTNKMSVVEERQEKIKQEEHRHLRQQNKQKEHYLPDRNERQKETAKRIEEAAERRQDRSAKTLARQQIQSMQQQKQNKERNDERLASTIDRKKELDAYKAHYVANNTKESRHTNRYMPMDVYNAALEEEREMQREQARLLALKAQQDGTESGGGGSRRTSVAAVSFARTA